ncbi:MAG: leucine-rich repeat domain-containing protein, partial [Oscillospiraceae bacterium]|nr:leucine-rich repeat domain-containing protein [Oscillospiraceae bacterium]
FKKKNYIQKSIKFTLAFVFVFCCFLSTNNGDVCAQDSAVLVSLEFENKGSIESLEAQMQDNITKRFYKLKLNSDGIFFEFIIPYQLTQNSKENNFRQIQSVGMSKCTTDKDNVDIPQKIIVFGIECRDKLIEHEVDVLNKYCFQGNKSIVNVFIPNSVKTLGRRCFRGSCNLKNINIPDSVIYIDTACFVDCSSFTHIAIPSSVVKLSSSCFNSCMNLVEVSCLGFIKKIENCCFRRCKSLKTISFANSKDYSEPTETIILPDSIDCICNCCFRDCSSVKAFVIPESVKKIGWDSFSGCSSLLSVIILARNIDFPSQLSRSRFGGQAVIGKRELRIFYGCSSLQNFSYAGTLPEDFFENTFLYG